LAYTEVAEPISSFCVVYNKTTTQEIVGFTVKDSNDTTMPVPAGTVLKINYSASLNLPVPGKIKKLFVSDPPDASYPESVGFFGFFSLDSQYYFRSTPGGNPNPIKVSGQEFVFDNTSFFRQNQNVRYYRFTTTYQDPPGSGQVEYNKPSIFGMQDCIARNNKQIYRHVVGVGYEENNIEEKFNGTYFSFLNYGDMPKWQNNILLLSTALSASARYFLFSSNTEDLYYAFAPDLKTEDATLPIPKILPIKSNTFGSLANTKKLFIYQERAQYIASFYGINAQDQGFIYFNQAFSAISDLIEMYDRKYIIGISPGGELVKCDLSRGNYWTKKNISEAIYSKSLHNINCKTAISGLCHDGKTNV
jgi:hypothetical protein